MRVLNDTCGRKAINLFEVRLVEEGWNPDNTKTTNYYNANHSKIKQNKSLKADFTSDEFISNGTVEDLINDFGVRYKEGSIEDVEDYFKFVDEMNCDRLLFKGGLAREKFD